MSITRTLGPEGREFSGVKVAADDPTNVTANDTPTTLDIGAGGEQVFYDTDGYFDAGDSTIISIAEAGHYQVTVRWRFDPDGANDLLFFQTYVNYTIPSTAGNDTLCLWQFLQIWLEDAGGLNGVAIATTSEDAYLEAGSELSCIASADSGSGTTVVSVRPIISVHRISASGPQGPSGGPPIGSIIMWSGTIASIPSGYALCDGTANTPGPDLRDKFVVGAKQDDSGVAKTNLTGSLTASGSAAVSAHSLSTNVALSAHSRTTDVALSAHTLSTNVAIANHSLSTASARTSNASTIAAVTTTGPSHTITQPVVAAHSITQPVFGDHSITQPVVSNHTSNWPSYYAVAFIQRMS